MKKPFLTSALALAMTAGATAPAHAADAHKEWVDVQSYCNAFTCIPVYLIYLLVPAVQSGRG